jgi:ABC-type dipeptide/oligopeptide/nickel transport system ATPase component
MSLFPSELSGGMKQRVNIAMALMVDPLLFIADEPTTALDAQIQYQVMELLKKTHEDTKNSMVIISHDLSLIKNYCDYVLVIYKGVVQEKDKVENIFNNPKAAYTKALLNVNVKFDQDKNKPLKDIRDYLKTEG